MKIHCQLSHIMQNLPVLYFICAHNLLLITCFITSLIAAVLVKSSLCQNKTQGNTLPMFVVKEEKKKRKSGGTYRFSVKQDLWVWATMGCTVTKKNGWRNLRTLVNHQWGWRTNYNKCLLHKITGERTQFWNFHNKRFKCRCRHIHLKISSFNFGPIWLHKAMVSKNIWRTKKPKLEQQNTNAGKKIF